MITYKCICGAEEAVPVPDETEPFMATLNHVAPPTPKTLKPMTLWSTSKKTGIRRSVTFWYCNTKCLAEWSRVHPDPVKTVGVP